MVKPTHTTTGIKLGNGCILGINYACKIKKFQNRSESSNQKHESEFEYTAKYRSKNNHLVEQGFVHLANKGHVMMNDANLPLVMSYNLCEG